MQPSYQAFENEPNPSEARSWRNFFVCLAGTTSGAHDRIVQGLIRAGHSEVDSTDDCDYILVFCPISSRVQSNIEDGLSRVTANKPIILVVMHHTFDPNRIVAESRRQVKNQNVKLTEDCLFFESELLTCSLNDTSWTHIQIFLQLPINQESPRIIPCMSNRNVMLSAIMVMAVTVLVMTFAFLVESLEKLNKTNKG